MMRTVLGYYQRSVLEWATACFGDDLTRNPLQRNHRFLEESLELVQAMGCTEEEALQLVEYVYDRPAGQRRQEIGGVMVTLALLCAVHDIDLATCADDELKRIWGKIEQIRAKQAAKPEFSPLPGRTP